MTLDLEGLIRKMDKLCEIHPTAPKLQTARTKLAAMITQIEKLERGVDKLGLEYHGEGWETCISALKFDHIVNGSVWQVAAILRAVLAMSVRAQFARDGQHVVVIRIDQYQELLDDFQHYMKSMTSPRTILQHFKQLWDKLLRVCQDWVHLEIAVTKAEEQTGDAIQLIRKIEYVCKHLGHEMDTLNQQHWTNRLKDLVECCGNVDGEIEPELKTFCDDLHETYPHFWQQVEEEGDRYSSPSLGSTSPSRSRSRSRSQSHIGIPAGAQSQPISIASTSRSSSHSSTRMSHSLAKFSPRARLV